MIVPITPADLVQRIRGCMRLADSRLKAACLGIAMTLRLPAVPATRVTVAVLAVASWLLQAHRQSPILGSFESVPEVRVLSSAGITRPHRSYDPVRLPPGPPCSPRRWRCDLRPERASPDYPDHLSNVPCPIPRWIGTGAYVGCFPIPRGLPRFPGGSASTISLSRPAQTSLALRPAGSLNRPRRPLSRGFETAGYPTAPLVSYQINRQLSGWYLPPLVIRAFGAHWERAATFSSA